MRQLAKHYESTEAIGTLRKATCAIIQPKSGKVLICSFAGVPCPPFSKAGKQLGGEDERDLFPEAIRLVAECKPQAVMLENVRGLLDSVFDEYRTKIIADLKSLAMSPNGVCLMQATLAFLSCVHA